MNTITVPKDRLVATLKENRDAHRALFLEAQAGYRAKVIELLDQRLEDARNGRQIDLAFRLPEPQDYTQEFDRVIAMLEWDTDDEVQLDQHDFQRYVQNEWEWARNFAASTQGYLVSP